MKEAEQKKSNIRIEVVLAGIVLAVPLGLLQLLSSLLFVLVPVLLIGLVAVAFLGVCGVVAGVAMIGVGIEKLFSMPMGAIAVMGFGFANIGVALLAECVVFWVYGVGIPAFVRKITGKGEKHEKTS